MADLDATWFLANNNEDTYKVKGSNLKNQDPNLWYLANDGTDTYKTRLFEESDLDLQIKWVGPLGSSVDSNVVSCRYVTNRRSFDLFYLDYACRRYNDDGTFFETPKTRSNCVVVTPYTNTSFTDRKWTYVIYYKNREFVESNQFKLPAFTGAPCERIYVNQPLTITDNTVFLDQDEFHWYDFSGRELTDDEYKNLHMRWYNAHSGQKIRDSEAFGDIRDPANRTLDISAGSLTDIYGNDVQDVTLLIERKVSGTTGTVLGSSGYVEPVRPFAPADALRFKDSLLDKWFLCLDGTDAKKVYGTDFKTLF